jgi:hypothetical protein
VLGIFLRSRTLIVEDQVEDQLSCHHFFKTRANNNLECIKAGSTADDLMSEEDARVDEKNVTLCRRWQ